MARLFLLAACGLWLAACNLSENKAPWEKYGKLQVVENSRIIQHENGTPFLWLGCTSWGMTEWLSREEVDLYLDDRKSKGMNVVQFCLFWGKRVDYPTRFTANAPNYYGYKAFMETDSLPDPTRPAIVEGGSPENPNDYWDHVDYCMQAIKQRGMYAAVLPFWGRRYVNAFHENQSLSVFTLENISEYGRFLGKRYGDEPNIIWVSGGDVSADGGGDYRQHYRLFAEGLVKGATGESVKWNEENEAWDEVFMTYHPAGTPMKNSSTWFHDDPWLDFNMIETHIHKDYIAASIRQDLAKGPLKPTILAEPHYEGITNGHEARAIHIRRQAYQSFFAGAAGHTYGGGFDEEGNGPLFSPSNNWKQLLDWEGAGQLIHLRKFLEAYDWWNWSPSPGLIVENRGEGELEKLAAINGKVILVYFPENSACTLRNENLQNAIWFNTNTGEYLNGEVNNHSKYKLPNAWEDGILILN